MKEKESMGKTVITKEVAEQMLQLRKQGKSIPKISKTFGLNPGSVRMHFYRQTNEKEWQEAKASVPNMNRAYYCPSSGFDPKKLKHVIDTLKRNIYAFTTLLIIGYQHCEEIVDLMKRYGIHVIAIDCRRQAFYGAEGIETIVANALDLEEITKILDRIIRDYPKCAIYYNLTGRIYLLEEIYKRKFYPKISVVSSRLGGKDVSSFEQSKQLNAKSHHLKGSMSVAISE